MDTHGHQNSWPHALSQTEETLAIRDLLKTLAATAAPTEVVLFLKKKVRQHGLAVFVARCLPIFNQAVGDAWLSKRLSIVTEHRYTDAV